MTRRVLIVVVSILTVQAMVVSAGEKGKSAFALSLFAGMQPGIDEVYFYFTEEPEKCVPRLHTASVCLIGAFVYLSH